MSEQVNSVQPIQVATEPRNDENAFQDHVAIEGTTDLERIEAPITLKAYLMCCFASFAGVYYGYDSGYISGVMGMEYFIHEFTGKVKGTIPDDQFVLSSSQKSLITSILSAGTFIGSLVGGDLADWVGRRPVIISGCLIFIIGAVCQVASTAIPLLVVGRVIAGLGVGLVSAVVVLYMSEIAPKKVRGAIVSGYQFCITIGLLLAACVDYGTQNRTDSGSYRIPIAIQFLWALILATGLFLLPESPRYFVKKGQIQKATHVLARLRGQPEDSKYIQDEIAEIVANHEYEMSVIPTQTYFQSWKACFTGGLRKSSSNLRRTILGTSLQMFQQLTGINFIFYFGTTFFQQLGSIKNEFLISLITTLVNVCSTPLSFVIVERLGRRPMLIYGALGMVICEFIVAIVGVIRPDDDNAVKSMIAFICIYIFFFASTWGPGAWVVVGEIYPLTIRSRAVGLSTASNWLWNCIIAVITPYMVDSDKGNLKAKVFFIWGACCAGCLVFAYVFIPETKGLTLEQVDRMLEETTPFTSAKWKPHSTFAADMGLAAETKATVNHDEKMSSEESV
ncbi:unnamed protein product [Ambrosiozyma monospora]|uniref:Unnamed protein product n=1 Tax=Ambrosiozyma monospora TaxID=43982 RepID=A0ACB5SW61_AMBMO|nr:unnamed protein product [Ambrosiozyma monospora]